MNKHLELANKIRVLVGDDKTKDAIKFLLEERIPSLEKDLRNLESRLRRVKKAQLSGTIDSSSFSLEYNRINDALLNLAKELEDYPVKTQVAEKKKSNIKKITIGALVILMASLGTAWGISYSKENAKLNAEAACTEKWANCLEKGEVDTYKAFTESKSCSNDSLARIANDSIAAINQRNAWRLAKTTNTFQSYADFYANFPVSDAFLLHVEELKPMVENKFKAFYRFDGDTDDAVGQHNGKGAFWEHNYPYTVDRFKKEDRAYQFHRPDKSPDVKNQDIAEYIEFSSPVVSPSSEVYSISLWVKFDRSDEGGTLFGQYQDPNEYFWHKWGRYNHQVSLTPETLGVDEFFPSGGALKDKISPGLALGKWHHVVIARDPASLYLYLDGDLIGEWPYDESYQLAGDKSGNDIKLARIGGWRTPFKGKIDDLGFSETTLSASEVEFICAVQKAYED